MSQKITYKVGLNAASVKTRMTYPQKSLRRDFEHFAPPNKNELVQSTSDYPWRTTLLNSKIKSRENLSKNHLKC